MEGLRRKSGKSGGGMIWHIQEASRPLKERKLLLKLLASRSHFALENQGGVHFQAGGKGGGVYGILLKPNVNDKFVSGLLNSKTLDFYLRHISSVYSSGFYSYSDAFLKHLPIPPATKTQQTTIANFAQDLTEKTARLRGLEAQVAAFPASVTELRRSEGSVPDLEVLSRLGLLAGLPKEVRADKLTSEHDLAGQVVFRVGNGRMTLAPALAALVEAVLAVRRKLTSEDLEALDVPEKEREQRAYVEVLSGWQREIVKLREEISGLEANLNNAVYEVYGLDEADQEVVAAFLARF